MNPAPHDSAIMAASTGPRSTPRHFFWEKGWNWGWPTRIPLALRVFLAWTAVGLFQSVPEMVAGAGWPVPVAKVLEGWTWALLTPAVLLIDRKVTSTEQNVIRLVPLFFLLSIPFSVAHAYLAALISYPFPQIWWDPLRNKEYIVYYLIGGWQTFAAFIAILQALKYNGRFLTGRLQLERVEKTLIEARLNILRLQLEPHFLFNALNAISSELSVDPKLARDMISDLGTLLRRSLDCQDRAEIALADELTLLEHYLSIQRVRFGDRLQISVHVEPEALFTMVPSMLLQPLVENAIRHGIERRMSGGTIIISASRVEDFLQVLVLDDGVGLPRNWQPDSSKGIGLRVTRERLEALYPEVGADCFTIRRRKGGGTEVVIHIPWYETENGAHEAVT